MDEQRKLHLKFEPKRGKTLIPVLPLLFHIFEKFSEYDLFKKSQEHNGTSNYQLCVLIGIN